MPGNSHIEKEGSPPSWFTAAIDGLTEKLESQNTKLDNIQGSVALLSQKQEEMEKKVTELEQHQIHDQKELSSLRQELLQTKSALQLAQGKIMDETRSKNILLMGISEKERNDAERVRLAEEVILAATGYKVKVDGASRLPYQPIPGKTRPIKVNLLSLSDRNNILQIAKERAQGGYSNIKADLSEQTREQLKRKWDERQRSQPQHSHQQSTGRDGSAGMLNGKSHWPHQLNTHQPQQRK